MILIVVSRDVQQNDLYIIIKFIIEIYIVRLLLNAKADPNIDHITLYNLKNDYWVKKTPRLWTTSYDPK